MTRFLQTNITGPLSWSNKEVLIHRGDSIIGKLNPRYLQSRSMNFAASVLPRLSFLLSGPFSGTNLEAGTRAP